MSFKSCFFFNISEEKTICRSNHALYTCCLPCVLQHFVFLICRSGFLFLLGVVILVRILVIAMFLEYHFTKCIFKQFNVSTIFFIVTIILNRPTLFDTKATKSNVKCAMKIIQLKINRIIKYVKKI